MCGMMAMQAEGGLGYDDLNLLMKQPEDLEFIFEVLSVSQPEDYEKESWQMDAEEKIASVPQLKEEGNKLFVAKNYEPAALKYRDALGRLEQLLLREKPGEQEWEELLDLKMPLLLNLAQCRLSLGEFYECVEHCDEVLKHRPDNVKALFRRAKAQVSDRLSTLPLLPVQVGAWAPQEARQGFQRVSELDPSLKAACVKEMAAIDVLEKSKDLEDKEKMTKLFN